MNKPENVYFADLMTDPLRQWAVAVGRHLVWQASRPNVPHTVRECWIGTDHALYIRYTNRSGQFGARFARLHHDPTSGQLLDPMMREHATGSAAQQASNLYDGGLGGGPPATVEWTDDLGYHWWGDTPSAGWPKAVDSPRSDIIAGVDQT